MAIPIRPEISFPQPAVISKTISAATAAPFPPKPSNSTPLPRSQQRSSLDNISLISRRNAGVLLSFLIAPLAPFLRFPPPATAVSFGISGPKEWLKEQKKKSSKYLLAPIDASRNSLNAAYLVLTKDEPDHAEKDSEKVKNLVNSAIRDCVAEERNSFVAFQAKTGVEVCTMTNELGLYNEMLDIMEKKMQVCTFRLIVNNAASLLDDRDPIKLEAESKLTDLIRSFASLSDLASEVNIQVASSRQRVASALMDTIFSLNIFEKGIKDCLEI